MSQDSGQNAAETPVSDTLPEPPKSCRGRCTSWTALLLSLIAVGGFLSAPFWMPLWYSLLTGRTNPVNLAEALDMRLARLEHNQASLEKLSDQQQRTQVQVEALSEQALPALQQDLETLKTQAGLPEALTTLPQKVQELEQKLAALETAITSRQQATDPGPWLLLLSLDRLREAVGEGRPYREELEATHALARQNATMISLLDTLAQKAGSGVPTLQELSLELQALVPDLLRADITSRSNNWWERLWNRIRSIVTIQHTGEAGDSASAIISRAERALANGNLDTAFSEISGLKGEIASSWLARAESRHTAEAVLGALSDLAMTGITARAPPDPVPMPVPPGGKASRP
ncbi:MAG: hypothetical protein M3O22_01095 [Pseudomonadota bacterium]|nr:hypothetical protein [Pseudomonadota bacterium]